MHSFSEHQLGGQNNAVFCCPPAFEASDSRCLARMPDSCCAIRCTNRRGNVPALCLHRSLKKKKQKEGDCGFLPLNMPRSQGRANNGSRQNTFRFAAKVTSSNYCFFKAINHIFTYRSDVDCCPVALMSYTTFSC